MDPSGKNHDQRGGGSSKEVSREWSEGLTAAAARHEGCGPGGTGGVGEKPPSRAGGSTSPSLPDRRSERADAADGPLDEHHAGSAAVKHQEHRSSRRDSRSPERGDPSMIMDRGGGEEAMDRSLGSAERDTAHFKMVAMRFRALMERRERRLEEAMSDPQTRTDLEAMFPGIKDGDYQTLLAGVRGMEEEDFQLLLAGARKRRRQVRVCGARSRGACGRGARGRGGWWERD